MQTVVQDYEQQIVAISESFNAAELENEAARDMVQRHYAQQEAEQLLVFQTARAEAGEAASEEYNMLKLSREAQVCTGRGFFVISLAAPQRGHVLERFEAASKGTTCCRSDILHECRLLH